MSMQTMKTLQGGVLPFAWFYCALTWVSLSLPFVFLFWTPFFFYYPFFSFLFPCFSAHFQNYISFINHPSIHCSTNLFFLPKFLVIQLKTHLLQQNIKVSFLSPDPKLILNTSMKYGLIQLCIYSLITGINVDKSLKLK